jgi:hypothetical protein
MMYMYIYINISVCVVCGIDVPFEEALIGLQGAGKHDTGTCKG